MALTKRAKLPVGKMVRVKPGEVVTGYQANRDGTTSLLIEKKRRAPNPKRRPAKRKNPSVRKSKKYFKRAAKRLGVKLPKRVPRKVTHSKGNRKRVTRKKR